MERRRVVITGLGAVTPIGLTVGESWQAVKNGVCGIGPITHYDPSAQKVKLAAEVKGFDPESLLGRQEAKRMGRFTQFAVAAAREALSDAGFSAEQADPDRCGVILSSGIGGQAITETEHCRGLEKGFDRVSPFYVPTAICNMAAGQVAIDAGFRAMCSCPVTACAGGTNAVGDAFHYIRDGYAEVMLCGGTEASITPMSIGGFTSMKALTQTEDPNRASIPFDAERSGFVMGEGAAFLILEDLDYAIDYGPVYKDVFSASRGLAKGFKVEVLLLRGTDEDYAKVPELANEVLSNYEFKLEESFEDVFKNGYKSTEIMFSRFLSAKKLADVDMNVASIKKLMCGKYKPNDQFFDIFNSTNDIRYALTFDSVLYEQFNSTNKTLILKKLWRTDGNCPMFYMRLAQMKLFQAEALEHNGASVADVLAPLNDLRRRSGNVLLKAEDFSDRDDLVRTIFYEIVREMGLENGAEWFAAVRMRLSSGKRLISELNPVYSDDKQLAWQIPDDEVSYNTLMEPNPVFIRE